MNFPSHKKDWKKLKLNQLLLIYKSIVLTILYVPYNTEEIRHAYKSKYNLELENQVILLITDGEKWHYLAIKKLSELFRGITSKHVGDCYCLNCFCSYSTENKLRKHKNECGNHDYCCHVELPKEDNKILKYNHGGKSMKVPFIIYADLESLLEKMNTCQQLSHQQLR